MTTLMKKKSSVAGRKKAVIVEKETISKKQVRLKRENSMVMKNAALAMDVLSLSPLL